MKTVILAEKPSQAKAYADAFTVTSRQKTHIELAQSQLFPHGAIITWGIGHLVELKEPKAYDKKWTRWTLNSLPILPERYEFQIAKGKYAQFQAVKKFILAADTVINACDLDISL
ncbi:toprim domain-containing protein [Sporosarcina sp. FSL K6-2383]|uniref:toprim domain-containing protein n=1 Tax=Sporosarcina sp. FSL K6-2383 TaxID=2921556 RepID=UPI00315B3DB2